MRSTKVICTTIDVPARSITDDENDVIKRCLMANFVNKCKFGTYIMGIKNILLKGATTVIKSRNDGTCFIDVQVTFETFEYMPGDLIAGVSVISLANTINTAEALNAQIYIQAQQNTKFVGVGYKLPIRVTAAVYTGAKINLSGSIYYPAYTCAYEVNTGEVVDPKLVKSMSLWLDKLNQINDIGKTMAITEADIKFFKDVFYRYKKPFDPKHPIPFATLVNIWEPIPDLGRGKLLWHPYIDRSSPYAIFVSNENWGEFSKLVMISRYTHVKMEPRRLGEAVLLLQREAFKYKKFLYECHTAYPDEETKTRHDGLWSHYRDIQRDVDEDMKTTVPKKTIMPRK